MNSMTRGYDVLLTHTVYGTYDAGTEMYDIYFTPGDLYSNCSKYSEVKELRAKMETARLNIWMGLEDIKNIDPDNPPTVFRFCYNGVKTDWYGTPSDAIKEAEVLRMNTLIAEIHRGRLHPKIYEPVTFPREVILEMGPKGLYTKMELHPEINGPLSGKYYFPNRTCQNLCVGPAIVHGAVDKATYGFIEVEMKKWELPDDRKVIMETLTKYSERYSGLEVCEIKCPFGHLLYVSNMARVFVLAGGFNGELADITEEVERYVAELSESQVNKIKELPIRDYICQIGVDLSEAELNKMFESCQFSFVDAIDMSEDNPLLAMAIDIDLIGKKSIGNICYYTINRNRISEFAVHFDRQQLESMAEIVRNANEDATKVFGERLKAGTMRLTL